MSERSSKRDKKNNPTTFAIKTSKETHTVIPILTTD